MQLNRILLRCMHQRVYASLLVHGHAHKFLFVVIYAHVCKHAYSYFYLTIRPTSVCSFARMCLCMDMHISAYIWPYKHMYACIHTHPYYLITSLLPFPHLSIPHLCFMSILTRVAQNFPFYFFLTIYLRLFLMNNASFPWHNLYH